MPPDHFGAYVAWLGDKHYFLKGTGLADEVGSSIVVDEDFNPELDELLRRDD